MRKTNRNLSGCCQYANRHLGQLGARAFGYDAVSGRFVGTQDNNLTLLDYDRTDWSYREAEQQQLDFETEELINESPVDDLPF